MLAGSCTLVAAGGYFAQPLARLIGQDLQLRSWAFGLIVTLGQLGYVAGLLLVAPLGDRMEARSLLVRTLAASAVALGVAALSRQGGVFLVACFGIGVAATAVQMLVSVAAITAAAEHRGRAIGVVTSGLLTGMLLAWPIAILIHAHWGWRAIFGGDAVVVATLALLLRFSLPVHQPASPRRYVELLRSLHMLVCSEPELRYRASMQAFLFGAFSLFWTAVPSTLAHRFDLGPSALAAFGAVGAGAAFAAPLAGRAADRGLGRRASAVCIAAVGTAFAMAAICGAHGIAVWALAGVAIGAGVQGSHVISQRAVLSISVQTASRLNSLYVATFIVGGACGSAAAMTLLALGGDRAVTLAGVALALGAGILWRFRGHRF